MQSSFSAINTNYDQLTHFKINKRLGYSKYPVYHLQVLPQGAEYAIKVFPDTEAAFEAYCREKEILSSISHPNIVQCIPEVYFNNINSVHCHCILLEYTPYEDFFTLVKKRGLTNDKLIRTYFHQLIEGMEYLHSHGIAHLDLKLENLLLGRNFQLIVADFDQSQSISEKQLLAQGTSCYRSPEVLERKCQDFFAADAYSLGIILFLFKTREFPFIERNKGGAPELLDYNLFQQNNKSFWEKKAQDKKEQPFFSESFKELINGMLEADPVKRWTIQDIKCSNWYNEPILEYEAFATRMEKVVERIFSKQVMKALP